MTASIDVTGLAAFSKSLRRAVAGDLQTGAGQEHPGRRAQDRSATCTAPRSPRSRSAPSARSTSQTSATVSTSRAVAAADLAAVLFDGAEYGGRKSRKVTYATRSPLGPAVHREPPDHDAVPAPPGPRRLLLLADHPGLAAEAGRRQQEAARREGAGGRLMGTIDTLLRIKADATPGRRRAQAPAGAAWRRPPRTRRPPRRRSTSLDGSTPDQRQRPRRSRPPARRSSGSGT